MHIIVENVTYPSPKVKDFVSDLVQSNSNNLSMFIYEKDSLLYPYLSQREVTRAFMLLSRVGVNSYERTYLLLAKDKDSSTPLGFALLSPDLENKKSCSITMVAVAAEHRKQGVFTKIMLAIKAEFNSNLSLTCKPEMVAFYEKFGFIPNGFYQTNISMILYPDKKGGKLLSVDDEVVMKNPKVLKKYQELLARNEKNVVDIAIKKWQEDFANGEIRAEQYWKEIKGVKKI